MTEAISTSPALHADASPASFESAGAHSSAPASSNTGGRAGRKRPIARLRSVFLFGLLVLVCYFVGRNLASALRPLDWKTVHFRYGAMALSVACLMGVRLLNAFSCRAILVSFGHLLNRRWLVGALWVASLGRYVPGKVVAGLSATVMIARRGVGLATAAATMLLNTAMMLVVGVMFSVPLVLTPSMRAQLPGIWLVSLVVIAAGIISLHPRVFVWLCNFGLRRWPLPRRPLIGPYLRAILLLLIRATVLGGALYFAARSVTGVGPRDFPIILSAMALTGVIGFLSFFVPAGLGVQEEIFLLTLTPLLGAADAALIALIFRAMQAVSDALAGTVGMVLLHPRVCGLQPTASFAIAPLNESPAPSRPTDRHSPPSGGWTPPAAFSLASTPPLLKEMPHKPDFFIVGAHKCGTTSLYEYLAQHPQVFMSPHKEPHFFARDLQIPVEWCVRDDRQYIRLFDKAGAASRIGEASVWYLFSKSAAMELRDFSPDAQIIIMLRDPIDVMYSTHGQFLWNRNEEILDFREALAAQSERARGLRIPREAHLPAALQYLEMASFASQVQRYHDAFGPDRVHVILFDDFSRDTAREYQKVLKFLGLDESFTPTFKVFNAAKPITPRLNSFLARHPLLRRFIRAAIPGAVIRRAIYLLPYLVTTVKRPSRMDPALRQELLPTLLPDIERLEKLLNRDLSPWKK